MLKLDQANRAIEAAHRYAREQGYSISVTVCDAMGHLITHQRMDDALLWTSHGSMGKAIASAGLGTPSGEESDVDIRRSSVSVVVGTGAPVVRRPGGLPVWRGPDLEGGIGVAGAPTGAQDEDCARFGLEAIRQFAELFRASDVDGDAEFEPLDD